MKQTVKKKNFGYVNRKICIYEISHVFFMKYLLSFILRLFNVSLQSFFASITPSFHSIFLFLAPQKPQNEPNKTPNTHSLKASVISPILMKKSLKDVLLALEIFSKIYAKEKS